MRGITKRFGQVTANRAVDLVLAEGEVLGLLGENGAGKTTLMNILFGLYTADSGTIRIAGRTARLRGPADALALGVGMVHQHFHLVPRHSVLENLMVGAGGLRLDRAGTVERLREIARRYGLWLDPQREVAELSIGEQQRLEIIKALIGGARILILDEPTSVLTPQETEGLFAALRAMTAAGVGIVFISHKLREVRAICGRLTVLRQGRVVADLDRPAEAGDRELATLMCGRELSPPVRPPAAPGEVLLALEGIATRRGAGRPVALEDVGLTLRAGEILGVAGVSGNGQRELADLLAGVLAPSRGSLSVRGRQVAHPSPARLRRLGLAQVPEDRIGDGLLPGLPLADSLLLPHVGRPRLSRGGVLRPGAIRGFVAERIAAFAVQCDGPDVRTGTLSGGNLQKALLARELAFDPLLLVAAQPTRGLDVAACAFVHQQLLALRGRGRAAIVISEDLEELFALSDRIAVMYEGRIAGVLPAAEATVAKVGLMMAGSSGAVA